MECKEELLRNISNIYATAKSLDEAYTKLVTELSNWTVDKMTTALAIPDNVSERLIKIYAGTLMSEGKSKRTIKEYMRVLKQFADDIQKPLDATTTFDIRMWISLKQQTISQRSCDNYRAYLSSFFTFLDREDLIQGNPTKRIKRIKYYTEEEDPFTVVEIDKMRSNINSLRSRACFEMLLSTGLRISELCNLQIRDINLDSKEVKIRHGKGNKYRVVYTDDLTVEYLRRYLSTRDDNCECMFKSKQGDKGLSTRTMELELSKLSERSGVDNVHPHRFRHTFASEKIRKGMDIRTLQVLMGHASIQTTMRYIKLADSHIKK